MTSSWIFVSSRQTATGRSGSTSVSVLSEAARRRGDSKATTVWGVANTRSSSVFLRGRKPTNCQRSAGSALATSALSARARAHARHQRGGSLALVVLVVADQTPGHAVAVEQHPGPAGVLAGDDVGLAPRGQNAP